MPSALSMFLSVIPSSTTAPPDPAPTSGASGPVPLTSAQLNTAVSTLNQTLLQVAIVVAVGLVVWLAATFVIRQIVKSVMAGPGLSERRIFKWAAPALRALDSERRAQRAQTIGSLLNSVVAVVITTIVAIYILKALGVDIAPLLTSVGILGVAIGFGAQQLIRDFLAGIFITLEDQYGIGDIIETGMGEVTGTVESVGLRITRVRADDGVIWYLRNGEILRLGNRSQGSYVPPVQDEPEPVDSGEPVVEETSNGGQRSSE